MVSPHPEWDDIKDGYRRGSTGVFVSPAIIRSGSHGSAHRSGDIPAEDANAYSVGLRTRMGTAGVVGAIDALDPSDFDVVRRVLDDDEFNQHDGGDTTDLLVKTAEPVTEPNGNDAVDTAENLSAEKSRKTNTGDGEGTDDTDAASRELDSEINTVNVETKPPTAEDAVKTRVRVTDPVGELDPNVNQQNACYS